MTLKQRIVSGISWSIAGSIVVQGFGIITKIILARLLFPEDFGLFAMAFILIQFLNLFVGFGIHSAVIYRKEDPEKTVGTAVIVATCIGFCLTMISYISAPFIAKFFSEATLEPMIKLLSFIFIIDSISTILSAVLIKELLFKKKTIVDICMVISYTIIVLGLAYLGYGTWSLIIAYICQRFIQLIFLWIVCPRKPIIIFDIEIAKDILHFGKYVLSTSFFAWAITSIDNIIVGKKTGDEGLGYYSFGFNIATLPVLSITHIISSVFHPIYAKVRDNKEQLQRAYLKPLEWSLLLILPLSMGLFLIADILVPVVFGEKWSAIIPLLKIFAVYGILRTVCTIISQLLEGVGKPRTASMLLAIELFIVIILIFPLFIWRGIIGVAIAVVIARGISMLLHLHQLKKIIPIKVQYYMKILNKKIISACIMGIIIYITKLFLAENSFIALVTCILVGIVVYIAILFFIERELFGEAKDLLRL